jgi:hypothetical protein
METYLREPGNSPKKTMKSRCDEQLPTLATLCTHTAIPALWNTKTLLEGDGKSRFLMANACKQRGGGGRGRY